MLCLTVIKRPKVVFKAEFGRGINLKADDQHLKGLPGHFCPKPFRRLGDHVYSKESNSREERNPQTAGVTHSQLGKWPRSTSLTAARWGIVRVHYCFQMLIFNFCLMPVPLNWARRERGLWQRHWWLWAPQTFDNKNTPLSFYRSVRVPAPLSGTPLPSPHAAPAPGPHDNTVREPRPPGPRPAALRASRSSGGHTCPAPLRARLWVPRVRGPARPFRLVAESVTRRPETLGARPPQPPRRSARARAAARRSP